MSTFQLDTVVKMKGLPFKATPEDVKRFFSGFALSHANVFLRRNEDGRPNGECFVVFENSDEAHRATQKDRETFSEKFGDRYVRVYPILDSDVSDMQTAVTQQHTPVPPPSSHTGSHADSVVKMKSLPFEATQLDIIKFFDGFRLKANGVQLVVKSDNQTTGEAFVDFETAEEASRATREKDHKVFNEKYGDRYIRLIQVTHKEMQATLALRFGGEGILKMKGIPFKATPADVRKFFAGFRIKPDGISFIMHPDGRPTGMAFMEFETPQEAVRAMEKDRAKFGPEYGDRFCMLSLVGRHEMDKVNLQRETDAMDPGKLTNGLSATQLAALASQAAALNLGPGLSSLLLNSGGNSGANPWLPMQLYNAALAQLSGLQGPGLPSGGPMEAGGLAYQYGNQMSTGKGVDSKLMEGMGPAESQQPWSAAMADSKQGRPVQQGGQGQPGLFYQQADERQWSDARMGLSSMGRPAGSPLLHASPGISSGGQQLSANMGSYLPGGHLGHSQQNHGSLAGHGGLPLGMAVGLDTQLGSSGMYGTLGGGDALRDTGHVRSSNT